MTSANQGMELSETVSLIVNGILGLAVVVLTIITIVMNKKSMEQEKKRRRLEVDIALYGKRFEVLRFLNELVYNYNDNKLSSEIFHNILFSAQYLFPEPIGSEIQYIFDAINDYYKEGKEPTKYLDRYKNHSLMKGRTGAALVKEAFYLEYMAICFKCSYFMMLRNDYKIDVPADLFKESEPAADSAVKP